LSKYEGYRYVAEQGTLGSPEGRKDMAGGWRLGELEPLVSLGV